MARAEEVESFEDVRQAFLARLPAELARLVSLSGSLGSAGRDPAPVLGELEEFAHRLRGAAAVFEAHELSEDAKLLELAAAAASLVRNPNNDSLVLAALTALARRLSSITRQ